MENCTKKAGHVCSYKKCKNKSYNSDCAVKFYSFPRDVERSKSWLLACNRMDLLGKTDSLHRSHKICSAHFQPWMFHKGKRQLLRNDAVPQSYRPLSMIDETQSSTSICFTETPQVLDTNKLYQLLEPASKDERTSEEAQSNQTSQICSPTKNVQTPEALISRTPRKEKLRQIITNLQDENRTLRTQIKNLRGKCDQLEKALEEKSVEKITLEKYKKFTYALCPSKKLADFIIIQVSQNMKAARGRRKNVAKTESQAVVASSSKGSQPVAFEFVDPSETIDDYKSESTPSIETKKIKVEQDEPECIDIQHVNYNPENSSEVLRLEEIKSEIKMEYTELSADFTNNCDFVEDVKEENCDFVEDIKEENCDFVGDIKEENCDLDANIKKECSDSPVDIKEEVCDIEK